MHERTELFSSHLFYKQVGTDDQREKLKETILQYRDELPNNVNNSNIDCWRNSIELSDIDWLHEGLHGLVEEALEYYTSADPAFANSIMEKRISSIYWTNVNEPGSINAVHSHPNATFACVYYVQGEGTGKLQFPNPANLLNNCYTISPFMRGVSFQPKDGELILFPGWLAHEVLRNNSDKQRINIAFEITVS